MDVREKMVELLQDENNPVWRWFPNNMAMMQLADYLIANGVTVQGLHGCEYCRTASYTENQFTVITQMGREVKTQFNFCPNCGRSLQQPPKRE